MLLWWWTVAVWLLARLGPGLADRFPTLPSLPDRPPSRANAWIALGVVAVAVLAFPPLRSLAPGVPHGLEDTVAAGTPWRLGLELNAGVAEEGRWQPALRDALREHYPAGRFTGSIFASETQGDFLVWALPRETPVLMFTHAHVFTVEHWEACRDVKAANPGWREFLTRHRANLITVEVNSHEELATALRADPEWLIAQDAASKKPDAAGVVIALRKKPL
jgi:hypothetical protein